MKKRLLIPVAFVASALFAQIGNAQSEILTFDDLPFITGAIANGYGDLNWQTFNYIDATASGSFESGIVSPANAAFNSGGDPAQISDSNGTFNLDSAYLTGGWNDGLQVEVQGFVAGTLAYDNTYTVSTIGPILINFDYLDVDKVNFISFGGTHNPSLSEFGEQFVMDNLAITIVPEPDARLLSLFSFSVAVLARRFALGRYKKFVAEKP